MGFSLLSYYLPKRAFVMKKARSSEPKLWLNVSKELDASSLRDPTSDDRAVLDKMLASIGLTAQDWKFWPREDQAREDQAREDQPLAAPLGVQQKILVIGAQSEASSDATVFCVPHPKEFEKNPLAKRQAWEVLKKLKASLGAFLLTSFFAFTALGFAPRDIQAKEVLFMEIRGSINPATAEFLSQSIKDAESAQSELLVVELDTPGGLLSSVRSMAQAIDQAKVPVVVWVHPGGASATSAGALLMLAAHFAVMAPGTNMGAAHPVGGQGEEIKGPMGDKVVEDTSAFARSLAEIRGRNPQLAALIVSKSKSMTAEEALKEKMIDHLVADRRELFAKLHGAVTKIQTESRTLSLSSAGPAVTERSREMSFRLKLMNFLANPNVAAILMSLAMILIYVEISNPGITFAGILGGLCLLIAFMAFQILPIQTGGVVLLIASLLLMVAEAFVASGGVLGIGAAVAFILGLLWAFDPMEGDLALSQLVLWSTGLSMAFVSFVVGVAAARTKKLSRQTLQAIGGGALQGLQGYTGRVETIDVPWDGTVTRGKAHFRGELWEFHAHEPLSVGAAIEAIKIDGFKVEAKAKI